LTRDPVLKLNTKPIQHRLPVPNWHVPFLAIISQCQVEQFVSASLKRDYAKLANRPDSKTVMAQLKDWFDDYNSYHQHSALGYLPPTLFSEKRSVT
jgi:transposase InsO family protein